MRICVIHGSPRKGNTYKAVKTVMKKLEDLSGESALEFTEFYLPQDMPHFCSGCYNCFLKGIEKCPHFKFSGPILEAVKAADGLIISSPVYVMAESAQIKALLDHFGSIYIPHRPEELMFSKVGLVVSTTVGGGLEKAVAVIKRNLKYWGFRRVISTGFPLYALNYSEMSEKKQRRIEAKLERKAVSFFKLAERRERLSPELFTRFWFFIMKKMISGYDEDNLDKQYWLQKGWLTGGSRPF